MLVSRLALVDALCAPTAELRGQHRYVCGTDSSMVTVVGLSHHYHEFCVRSFITGQTDQVQPAVPIVLLMLVPVLCATVTRRSWCKLPISLSPTTTAACCLPLKGEQHRSQTDPQTIREVRPHEHVHSSRLRENMG